MLIKSRELEKRKCFYLDFENNEQLSANAIMEIESNEILYQQNSFGKL